MENSSKTTPDSHAAPAPDAEQSIEVNTEDSSQRQGVSGLQVLQSTLAAAFGVQSRKNRERDFEQGKASQFIFAGILFTLVFIGVMVTIVRTVLSGT